MRNGISAINPLAERRDSSAMGRFAPSPTITSYFKKDPPTFYQVPFSYHNRAEMRRVLKQAGFREIKTEVIAKIGKAKRAEHVARGLVEGDPVAVAIAKRDPHCFP